MNRLELLDIIKQSLGYKQIVDLPVASGQDLSLPQGIYQGLLIAVNNDGLWRREKVPTAYRVLDEYGNIGKQVSWKEQVIKKHHIFEEAKNVLTAIKEEILVLIVKDQIVDVLKKPSPTKDEVEACLLGLVRIQESISHIPGIDTARNFKVYRKFDSDLTSLFQTPSSNRPEDIEARELLTEIVELL